MDDAEVIRLVAVDNISSIRIARKRGEKKGKTEEGEAWLQNGLRRASGSGKKNLAPLSA
jgi:hypothetical protein